MSKKTLLFLILSLSLSILIIGCSSSSDTGPIEISLEDSIRESISSKTDTYNFLEDSLYLDNIDLLVSSIKLNEKNSDVTYATGLLDDDNIPEIAVFIGKDPELPEDKGRLEIYKFNGLKYALLDSVSMNYDISNYDMKIGNLSKDQRGLLLNNHAGPRSGVTYAFIIEDKKLKSVLDSTKISLVSIFAENQIKDIDGDGILEFSIYTVDPETEDTSPENSDKLTLWYKWNGRDSADIVKIERNDFSASPSDKSLFREIEKSLDDDFSNFINLLKENQPNLSKHDNTVLLEKYITALNSKSYDKSLEIENIFINYQEGQSFNYIFDKYSITIDKLNNLEYLAREKVLKDEMKIKEHIIENINLGYKLNTQEGIYYYSIDYKKLVQLFEENISREYSDYLKILSLNSEKPYINNGRLTVSDENLVDRILLVESFKMIYPFSDLFKEINHIYELYFLAYLYGDKSNPKFDIESGQIEEAALEEFQLVIEKYSYTTFSDILQDFVNAIRKNNNKINDDIREQVNNRLN